MVRIFPLTKKERTKSKYGYGILIKTRFDEAISYVNLNATKSDINQLIELSMNDAKENLKALDSYQQNSIYAIPLKNLSELVPQDTGILTLVATVCNVQ